MCNKILVTGGAGFIGSHFITKMLSKGFSVLNFDALTYAADLNYLGQLEKYKRYRFFKGDIRSANDIASALISFKPNFIVNFAAETHVDRSLSNPQIFYDTNINGTFTLLESVKHYLQQEKPQNFKNLVHISTDEVYGTRGIKDPAAESSSIRPSNVYAASKASAEAFCMSYTKTFSLPIVITRCCNNYGKRQNSEKLIPKAIKLLKNGERFPLYGDGSQSRQWIHVEDHISALFKIMVHGEKGEIYNIGDKNFITNRDLLEKIFYILNEKDETIYKQFCDFIQFVEDRAGHDMSYSIDVSKLKENLGWTAQIDFKTGLRQLIIQ
jgi:dTDP-glucose 4,6-dehydratase